MKNISAWAIRHPVVPLVVFALMTVFGIVSFIRLPVTLNPDVSAPFVQVTIVVPGAAPSELEKQVLQKVEASIASVGNVKHLTSKASQGVAWTSVEFQLGTPVDRATNDVRDAVTRVRADLPQNMLEPQVSRIDIDGAPMASYAVSSSTMSNEQLSWFVDDTLSKRLLAVAGVAQVTRFGGASREIRVDLDPVRMGSMGITAAEVNQQLRAVNVDVGGGRAQIGGGEQSIRVLGGAHTAQVLSDTRLTMPDGRVARLRDIADVHDGVEEIRSIYRLNGRDATGFNIAKAKHYSDMSTLKLVDVELNKIRSEFPGVTIDQIFTTVDFTRKSYQGSIEALVEGALLAVVIVFLFLRDGRSTIISALAIPLAAFPTFAAMNWFGFTLNQMSLLALSLTTGVLVDDAIVEVENITRHMAMGKTGYQAALDAADEIGLAVVACSMAIIAIFIPVSFISGLVGQWFIQFGFTISVAVFLSLAVARTVTPVLAAYTLKPHAALRSADGPLLSWYLRLLAWSVSRAPLVRVRGVTVVSHRGATLAAGALVLVASVFGLTVIPSAFIPNDDNSYSQLNFDLPPGVTLAQVAAVGDEIQRRLQKDPEVKTITVFSGDGGDGEVRQGNVSIQLVEPDKRHMTQKQWEESAVKQLSTIPDARINFQSQNGGDGDVSLYAVGSDPDAVERLARNALEQMRPLKEFRDVRLRGEMSQPELELQPKLDVAAQLGVTVASISDTVRVATIGDNPQDSAKFSLSERQVPIRVSLKESARTSLSTLENLPVRTSNGGTVPLKAVVDIRYGQGPSAIRHYDQKRRIAIDADLAHGVVQGTALAAVHKLPIYTHSSGNAQLIEVGDSEYMGEFVTNFFFALVSGLLLVLAVLILLFARFFQPITILSALPLSIGGALIALAVTGSPNTIASGIGILMLMGIVAKNSILLVEFAIEEMRAGKSQIEALMEAGHKRARPIVMTSVAMIAGMLPVAWGIRGSNLFQGQMAVAVIGGLVTSTALTLVLVPAAFTVFDDIERFTGRLFGRWFTGKHAHNAGGSQPAVPAAVKSAPDHSP